MVVKDVGKAFAYWAITHPAETVLAGIALRSNAPLAMRLMGAYAWNTAKFTGANIKSTVRIVGKHGTKGIAVRGLARSAGSKFAAGTALGGVAPVLLIPLVSYEMAYFGEKVISSFMAKHHDNIPGNWRSTDRSTDDSSLSQIWDRHFG